MSKDDGRLAFPIPADHEHGIEGWDGMTLREYAAIHLQVPDSGTPWLDEMIKQAQRKDLIKTAMTALITTTGQKSHSNEIAAQATKYADSIMRKLKGGENE